MLVLPGTHLSDKVFPDDATTCANNDPRPYHRQLARTCSSGDLATVMMESALWSSVASPAPTRSASAKLTEITLTNSSNRRSASSTRSRIYHSTPSMSHVPTTHRPVRLLSRWQAQASRADRGLLPHSGVSVASVAREGNKPGYPRDLCVKSSGGGVPSDMCAGVRVYAGVCVCVHV